MSTHVHTHTRTHTDLVNIHVSLNVCISFPLQHRVWSSGVCQLGWWPPHFGRWCFLELSTMLSARVVPVVPVQNKQPAHLYHQPQVQLCLVEASRGGGRRSLDTISPELNCGVVVLSTPSW